MANFRRGGFVPGVPVLHRRGPFVPVVTSSSPVHYSQDYNNWIIYMNAMYPYYRNIDPHRIPSRGGGDHYPSTGLPWRARPISQWVQHEETLILDGDSNVATPRHGGPSSIEVLIAKNMKMNNCCDVEAEDEDGITKICTVCQDDLCGMYENEIGVLDCGHEYHACCIKNWLVRKNVCPLYDTTGVKVD